MIEIVILRLNENPPKFTGLFDYYEVLHKQLGVDYARAEQIFKRADQNQCSVIHKKKIKKEKIEEVRKYYVLGYGNI